MGDRYYMEIVCRREDAPLFEPVGFLLRGGCSLRDGRLQEDYADEVGSAVVHLFQDEANYACQVGSGSDGFGLLPKGVPFYGTHSAGGDYGDGVFATEGRVLHYAQALQNSGAPAVELNYETGRIDRRALRQAERYVASLTAVQAKFVALLRAKQPTGIYRVKGGLASTHYLSAADRRRYRYVLPARGFPPEATVADCWIVDRQGAINPGTAASPVPVRREDLGRRVAWA